MTDDAIQPDEVTTGPAPGAELAVTEPQQPATALEAAQDAVLAMPGVADHSEFWSLAAQARVLSLSGAAPKQVRENPHIALHMSMVGRDLGISPSAALELIDIIPGKGGEVRLSLSPQLLNGQVRRLGLGEVVAVERSNERCIAAAVGPGGTDRRCRVTGVLAHVEGCTCHVLGTTEFSWEDARIAELVGPNCKPGQHVKDQTRSSNGRSWKVCGCNQGYITYPKRMLWWRASGFCVDDYFPEAGLGLYTAEELGATVDENGRAIDVESVELPPGYEADALPAGRGGQQQQAPAVEQQADPGELWDLQARLHALPEGAKAELRALWKGEDSRVRGYLPHALPRNKLAAAKALVNAHWGKVRGTGVDMDVELAALHAQLLGTVPVMFLCTSRPATAPQAAQEPSQVAAGTEAPAGPVGADSGAQEPTDEPVDWRPAMKLVAEEVREAAEGVPPAVVERIASDVKGLHHSVVNFEIAEAELDDQYPPSSLIDLRRMVVCVLRLRAFRAAGVVPGGAPDDG